MNRQTEAVIREIEKVIIGKRSVVERVLMAVLSEGHILLDDVPGVGKTTLAVACSTSYGDGLPPDSVYPRCGTIGYHRLFHLQQGDGSL